MNYLRYRRALGELAPASVGVIFWVLRSLDAYMARHDLALATITRVDVERWLAERDRSPATTKSMLTKARPFFRWCVEQELLDRDPTLGIRAPRPPDGLPRCLDPVDVGDVLRACPDERARVAVLLMVQCGLRVGEVAAMRIEDVDWRRRTISIRGKGGRGRVTRSTPIPAEVLESLRRHVGARRSGPVLRSYQPPYDALTAHWLSRLVSRWLVDAGVKRAARDGVSAHAFRHTTAQDLVDAGTDLRVVQRLLGHRSIRTTEDYTRRDPPGLRAALEGRRYGR